MRNKGVKVYFTHNRYTSINLGITNLKWYSSWIMLRLDIYQLFTVFY
jgi:hypothetical protein